MTTPAARSDLCALLVDDDPLMLTHVAKLLSDLGVRRVETAHDGQQGCEILDRRGGRVDLVICDIEMPRMDGFQVMEQLAEREFKGGVVLISGLDSRTINSAVLMGKFHRLNVLAGLPKPVEPSALREALARLA